MRDRNGTFDPKLIAKYQRRFAVVGENRPVEAGIAIGPGTAASLAAFPVADVMPVIIPLPLQV